MAGYYDELTGAWIDDSSGGMDAPLDNTSGSVEAHPMSSTSFDTYAGNPNYYSNSPGAFDFSSVMANFFGSGGSFDAAAGTPGAGKPGENGLGGYGSPAPVDSKNPAPEQSLAKRISAFFGGADDWAKANKDSPLLQMGLIGLASHLKGESNKDLIKQQSNSYAERQERAAQIERDKIAANSASVSGITPVKGLIQRQLQRVNGQAVFQPNGRVA